MRLHRLRMQAFGPFAGTEEVDFDALAADGLHLIHGPTGAGKTSILDAICFALFAGLPGSRMQGRDTVCSDHAAPTTRPEVELEFSVGERRLRVRRSPEHRVPKKRGTGTRSQRGSVHLDELRAGRWDTLGTRADEVGQQIGDLLGMGLPQFAQVMLLPQGEFTAFLRAKPDDRGALLERLFDIEDFAAIEQWLIDRRKALEVEVAKSDAHRAALIGRAREALGALPGDDGDRDRTPDLDTHDVVSALRHIGAHLSRRLTAALAEADDAATRVDGLRSRLADQRTLAGLQRQARQAQQTLARLDAQATEVTGAADQLERATRSAACQPAVSALHRREAAHRAARQATDEARSALTGMTEWEVPESHGAALTDTALQPLRERAVAGDAALAGRPELLRQAKAIERELRSAIAVHERSAETATRCASDAAGLTDRLTQLTAQRDDELSSAALDPQWRALRAAVDTMSQAADSAAADAHSVVEAGVAHRAAQQAWATDEQEALRLRQARLAGVAAELSADLSDGAPCPVCGAVEHPHPARPDADHVDAERVTAAERAAKAALAHAEQAAARWSAATGRAEATCTALLAAFDRSSTDPRTTSEPPSGTHHEGLAAAREDLTATVSTHRPQVIALATALRDDPRSVGAEHVRQLQDLARSLRTAHSDVSDGATRAARAAEQVRALEQQLDDVRARQLTVEEAVARAGDEVREAGVRVDSLRARLAATRERLAQLVDDHAAACGCCSPEDDPADGHARCVERLDRLTDAARAEQSTRTELTAARAEVDGVLRDHGFDDIAAATAAALSDTERDHLQTCVETARTERVKALGVLEQPEVAAAIQEDPADVERVAAELSAAERITRHTQETVGEVRRTLQTLERIAAELDAHDQQSAPLREQLTVATALSAALTGSGDNVMRMRLTAYVLAARLETVTDLANERLQVMTAGRYQLEHTDEKAGRGRKSGLGLRVRDAWTGTVRDTATLSGGESFVASLALALGLGDAVLQSAGGRSLETLLVDEGFGSLDEDSLDQVLDVLDGLRAGGRSVGIVSHVAELRARIPSQIRVHKTPNGSTLQVVAADVA